MRWPKGTPLTMTRNQVDFHKVDAIHWDKLRLASIFTASVNALFNHGIWLPDLPQDVLYARSSDYTDWQAGKDAVLINNGQWEDVDFTRYENADEFMKLFIQLRPIFPNGIQGKILLELKNEIRQLAERTDSLAENELKVIIGNYPRLGHRISEAYARVKAELMAKERMIKEKLPDTEPWKEGEFINSHKIISSFLNAIKKSPEDPNREIGFTNDDSAKAKASVDLYFNPNKFLENFEMILRSIKVNPKTVSIWGFLRGMDTIVHEYAHTEEHYDIGRISHATHQKEGLLENSFPQRMRLIIERAISNRWDVYEVLRQSSDAAMVKDSIIRKGGIDLDSIKLQTENSGSEIKFHLDPAMLKQLQNVPGFVPIIINIQPMNNIRQFLGIKEHVNNVA